MTYLGDKESTRIPGVVMVITTTASRSSLLVAPYMEDINFTVKTLLPE